jgi:hypothetical protein
MAGNREKAYSAEKIGFNKAWYMAYNFVLISSPGLFFDPSLVQKR